MQDNLSEKLNRTDSQNLVNSLGVDVDLYEPLTSKIGLRYTGSVIAKIYETGKTKDNLADYVLGNNLEIQEQFSAAAKMLYDLFGQNEKMFAEFLSLIALSQKYGLIDCISPVGENGLLKCLNRVDKLSFESMSKLKNIINLEKIKTELIDMFYKISVDEKTSQMIMFKMGLLARMVSACLIEDAKTKALNLLNPTLKVTFVAWDKLSDGFEKYLLNKNFAQHEVTTLRQTISDTCLKLSNIKKGIYKLVAPTGGGKTLSSLRFAINHAKHHNLERIIYVVPNFSTTEQITETIKIFLKSQKIEPQILAEYISNLDDDIIENWDAQIVVTTMNQFLNTFFGAGIGNTQRMSSLLNSVIIFDEIESLPINSIYMFNAAIAFLYEICGTSALLCTATQIILDRVKFPLTVSNLFTAPKFPDRTIVNNLFSGRKMSFGQIKELALKTRNCLIIVNTKESARNLWEYLKKNTNITIKHLSTNMCPQNRINTLAETRELLMENKPVICVSTQFIEAGADINFKSVIRAMAGLDSILLAAGKCNRNGKEKEPQNVYIVEIEDEDLTNLAEVRIASNCGRELISNHKSCNLDGKAMEAFYSSYLLKRQNEMIYRVEEGLEDDLFNLLSSNTVAVSAAMKLSITPNVLFNQAFFTASKNFSSADQLTRWVIVPYGKVGNSILKAIEKCEKKTKLKRLFRKIQRFTIELTKKDFESLRAKKKIYKVRSDLQVYVLDLKQYSSDYGIISE